MRELKFRAWDKAYKEMCQMRDISGCLRVPEIFDVMQYTGLKDRNDVEIYEGDIVRMYGYVEGARVEMVTWESMIDHTNFEHGMDSIIVIGNIYENPELLEKAS